MKQRNAYLVSAANDWRDRHTGRRLWAREWHGGLACLATVAALVAGSECAAQSPASPARLSVRPHEMATGTRNARAGVQTLDSIPDYLVYVCQQCVGTKRVPLVVILHGGGGDSREQMEWMSPFAEKYGMIMLVPTATSPGRWDAVYNLMGSGGGEYPDVKKIDAAMQQVLRNYAIDPDKIALGGMSDGGSYSLFLGRSNLDIFSRVAPLSPGIYFNEPGPKNPKTQFFVAGGILEPGGFYLNPIRVAQELRQAGHSVTQALMLRPHQQRSEDYDYMWNWLHDSWAAPDAATRASAQAETDSTTVLTADAMAKMTAFWTSFAQEPDSITTAGRLAHQKQFAVQAGQERLLVRMMDMPAMAATYRSVAADLQQAGLTAAQEQAYRIALISARATVQAEELAGTAAATSVLGKNVAFFKAHESEINDLESAGMWNTP